MRLKLKDRSLDFRVSTLPNPYGEKVVIRLLDKSNLQLDLNRLGMERKDAFALKTSMYKSCGMILVTGPTGSGKTTTLYSVLMELNKDHRNIMTAEDPIEYNLEGLNQFQMNSKIGLTFAQALRAFLRQDPDVIMVGEIRDLETAEIAVKASLTGHLVLSTLHTNSAPETVARLVDMGVEPFLVASSVHLVIAQRLMRKLCPHCKEQVEVPDLLWEEFKDREHELEGLQLFQAKGCHHCRNTGYQGRLAVYEVMPMIDELREVIIQDASSILEIKKRARESGMMMLREAGFARVREGITSVEEWMRVT